MIFDVFAEDRQQYGTAGGRAEQFCVHKVLDAAHFGLGETTWRELLQDIHYRNAVSNKQNKYIFVNIFKRTLNLPEMHMIEDLHQIRGYDMQIL